MAKPSPQIVGILIDAKRHESNAHKKILLLNFLDKMKKEK